jgi:hypothetical protein
MYYPSPQTIFKRILSNPRASQAARIVALERIDNPPISLILKLLTDPKTPQRLLSKLAAAYDVAMEIRGK